MSFEELLEQMLSRVPDDVDKREGSIICTALAPIAAQLAEQQVYDDTVRDTVLPDTAEGNDLTRVCGVFGVPCDSHRASVCTNCRGRRVRRSARFPPRFRLYEL